MSDESHDSLEALFDQAIGQETVTPVDFHPDRFEHAAIKAINANIGVLASDLISDVRQEVSAGQYEEAIIALQGHVLGVSGLVQLIANMLPEESLILRSMEAVKHGKALATITNADGTLRMATREEADKAGIYAPAGMKLVTADDEDDTIEPVAAKGVGLYL